MYKKVLIQVHLSEANQHVERCEAFIQQQENLINRLIATDQDISEAVNLLEFLKTVLITLIEHRDLLLQELNA